MSKVIISQKRRKGVNQWFIKSGIAKGNNEAYADVWFYVMRLNLKGV